MYTPTRATATIARWARCRSRVRRRVRRAQDLATGAGNGRPPGRGQDESRVHRAGSQRSPPAGSAGPRRHPAIAGPERAARPEPVTDAPDGAGWTRLRRWSFWTRGRASARAAVGTVRGAGCLRALGRRSAGIGLLVSLPLGKYLLNPLTRADDVGPHGRVRHVRVPTADGRQDRVMLIGRLGRDDAAVAKVEL